jgi:putative endonuclease
MTGTMNPQQRGAQAEQRARAFLEHQGLVWVASNWRAHFQRQVGEIDLVMQHDKELVFVEVRTRSRADFGGAAASVDGRKQQKLRRTAQAYLHAHGLHQAFCRFDVVAIHGDELDWLRHAF